MITAKTANSVEWTQKRKVKTCGVGSSVIGMAFQRANSGRESRTMESCQIMESLVGRVFA